MGGCKKSRFLQLPVENLKSLYRDLKKFSHIYCAGGPNNNCSLKAVSQKMTSTVGIVDRMYIPRTGEWVESLQVLRFNS